MDNARFSQLKKQIKYVLNRSEFYAGKFRGLSGVDSIEDFQGLPLTTKQEVLDNQAKHPPFGSNLCVSPERIIRIHKTSGTTNKPVLIALTENDIKHTIEVGASCFSGSGLGPDDTVVHCLNYNMWAGGYTDHQSLETTGAAVIPFGVGHSHRLLETILWLKPTAIHCTPSYLAKLESIIRDDFKLTPADLSLRLGLFGAESGLQNPDFRKNIERVWDLKAMNANYGVSEVLSMFGAECGCQTGMHFMGGKCLWPELLNPATLQPIEISDGAVGELVLTNLFKESQPLIRYRTGDIIRSQTPECDCVDSVFQFTIVGRSDDMLVIKGVNVFPSNIENVINRYLDHITATYQVLLSKDKPIEDIVIKLELKSSCVESKDRLRERIIDDFARDVEIRPEIEFLDEGTLPRTEGKSKKLVRIL